MPDGNETSAVERQPAPPAGPTLAIVPDTAAATAAQVIRFTVNEANGPVTWSVAPEPPGLFRDGLYVAPRTVTEGSLHTVTATCNGATATALLRVVPVAVTITPSRVKMHLEERQQFAVSTAGDSTNSVTWTITPTAGTIVDGFYTPPAGPVQSDTVTVTATSKADPAQSASAEVTLIKPSPMTVPARRMLGWGLLLLCLAICGLIIAFWPFPSADLAKATAANDAAAKVLKDAQGALQRANQALDSAKQAAAANAKDPALQADVASKTTALATAQKTADQAEADAKEKADAAKQAADATVTILGTGHMSRELNYILIALIMGALGSFIHTAKSFAGFAGNRSLIASWIWWYVLQPFIGMTLALLFYLVVRGGFFASGTSANNVNVYGIAAVCGMVGMFAKQASDKLGELFSSMFKTSEDAQRKDKMTALPAPATAGSTSAPAAATAKASSGS